jgi:hypothetical protein
MSITNYMSEESENLELWQHATHVNTRSGYIGTKLRHEGHPAADILGRESKETENELYGQLLVTLLLAHRFLSP